MKLNIDDKQKNQNIESHIHIYDVPKGTAYKFWVP